MSKYAALCNNCKKEPVKYVVDLDEDHHIYSGWWEVKKYSALCNKCAIAMSMLHNSKPIKIKKIRYFNKLNHSNKKEIVCTINKKYKDKIKVGIVHAYCLY